MISTAIETTVRSMSVDTAEDFPEAVVDEVSRYLGKPRARGWIHVYSAAVAAIAGTALVSVSWSLQGARAGLATLVYTLTIVAMFAVSGFYHRVNWTSPTVHKWMKRLDHSMIFVFIAGSYTPFALLALPESDGWTLLWIVWGGALAGVLLKMFWPSAPRWVGVPLYLLLGWVAVWFIGPISSGAGMAAVVLLIVGGVLYSVGGVLYALKWPKALHQLRHKTIEHRVRANKRRHVWPALDAFPSFALGVI